MFDPCLHHPELMAEATGTDRRRGATVTKACPCTRSINRAVRLKYDDQPRRRRQNARRLVETAMDRIEQERGPSGYLVGDSFSVADLSAAAILSPFVRPPEFPYHQVDPARDPEDLRRWRDPLTEREAFKYVLEMYARHRGTSAEVATA